MKKKDNVKFKIDSKVLNDYVNAINSINIPMSQIRKQLEKMANNSLNEPTKIISKSLKNTETTIDTFSKIYDKSISEHLKSIYVMTKVFEKHLKNYSKEKNKIYNDVFKQIMEVNNGVISTRIIEPLNISRHYLSMFEKENKIEKVSRGMYISSNTFEDSYFSFQQKYKKAIFSHMSALYFHQLTEEFPYKYTITIPRNYHIDSLNEKCNTFYVPDDIYEMGVMEIKTPNGNKVRVYDKERCICDIIRSRKRMDYEQVKKSIKQYIRSHDKDIAKLSLYSKKMGINEEVMELVGDEYYE